MKLRKGVRFSDGEPLNAAAVKAQMEWIKDPKNGAWTAGWLKPLRAVEVADEHTIRWKFEEPWGGFLGVMANVPGYMISPKLLQDDPKKADTQPVGTGPYVLEDRSTGSWIKAKRNPSWWFGKSVGRPDMPYFDGTLTTVIPDPSVQLANLKSGKLDWMTLSKSQFEAVKGDPALNVYIDPVNHVRGYRFNPITIGLAILTESGTAFLGLGAEPPTASWGKELRVGYTYLERVPLFSLAPGLMITLTVLAFNFLGDGLRDALDPRLRGERVR